MIERQVTFYNYEIDEIIFRDIFEFEDKEDLDGFIESLYDMMSKVNTNYFKEKEKMQYTTFEISTIKFIAKYDRVTMMDSRRLLDCSVKIEPYLPEKLPIIFK